MKKYLTDHKFEDNILNEPSTSYGLLNGSTLDLIQWARNGVSMVS
jgi:hypothetical protein